MFWRWKGLRSHGVTLDAVAPAGATELVVSVEGTLVRALVAGGGPPLVLVHGLGNSARCWQHNLEALSACQKLYVLDLPGFGDSEAPDKVLSPRELADAVARWCQAVGLQRASFIGHSVGGEVCMWFAATYPTMVDRLVVAGSTGVPPGISLVRRIGRVFMDGPREPFGFLPTLLRGYFKAGPRRMLGTMAASDPDALARHLPSISAPTLVVWGGRDPVISREEAEAMAAGIPKARLEVIEEGAHGVIFDAPARFNSVVASFLAEEAGGCPRAASQDLDPRAQ